MGVTGWDGRRGGRRHGEAGQPGGHTAGTDRRSSAAQPQPRADRSPPRSLVPPRTSAPRNFGRSSASPPTGRDGTGRPHLRSGSPRPSAGAVAVRSAAEARMCARSLPPSLRRCPGRCRPALSCVWGGGGRGGHRRPWAPRGSRPDFPPPNPRLGDSSTRPESGGTGGGSGQWESGERSGGGERGRGGQSGRGGAEGREWRRCEEGAVRRALRAAGRICSSYPT